MEMHGNPFARALKSVAIIGPLFIRAIDVAQGLALAMDARGFAARDSRTSIVELRLTRADRFIMYSLLGASVLAVVLRVLGIGLITRNYL